MPDENLFFHEVGLRDGLQVEKKIVPTQTKLAWIEQLVEAGLDRVQLGSFVHPAKVPQMADTDAVFSLVRQRFSFGPKFSALVLNERGLERGFACGVEVFCMGVSASQTHSRKNTGMSVEDSLTRTLAMSRLALSEGKSVQVSIQSAFGCGFEGPISPARPLAIIEQYVEEGLDLISLADTAGHAHPRQVSEFLSEATRVAPSVKWSCHFHDTYGAGIANCLAAFDRGVRCFETAFGGLGGCPFTAVAGGNVCSEDLIHLFQRMGMRPDLKLEPIIRVSELAAKLLGRDLTGRVYKTGPVWGH